MSGGRDEAWDWTGRCTCCGCRVLFSVKWLDWDQRWAVEMTHYTLPRPDQVGTGYSRIMLEDEEMRDKQTLESVVRMVTRQLYENVGC